MKPKTISSENSSTSNSCQSLEAVVPAISEDEWNVIKAVTSVCFGDGPWYRCGIPCRVVESYTVILESIVLYTCTCVCICICIFR